MLNLSGKKSEQARILTNEQKLDIVRNFSSKILEKYDDRIKSIIMFGEPLVDVSEAGRDIDVFVVIDDVTQPLSPEELEKIESSFDEISDEVSEQLSVQSPYTLTNFWDEARRCTPIVYNMIRTGIPAYDSGFFVPIKRLLEQGRIPLTPEQIYKMIEDVPRKIQRAETVKLLMLAEDCYYAILNMSQAVLMLMDIEPPPPSKAYARVKKHLVEKKLLDPEYAEYIKEIYEIRKKIERKELLDVSGAFIDEWIEKSRKFLEEMFKLFAFVEFDRKKKIIERTHEVMYKAAAGALKSINKLPKREEKILDVFEKEFIAKKLISEHYLKAWARISELVDLINKEKFDAIHKMTYTEVLNIRDVIRVLIGDLAKVLKKKKKK